MKHLLFFLMASICLCVSASVPRVDRDELLHMSDQHFIPGCNNLFLSQLHFQDNENQNAGGEIPTETPHYSLASLKQHLSSHGSTRSTSDGLMKNKIVFYDLFDWKTINGEIIVSANVPASYGGQTIHMSATGDDHTVYSDDLIINGIYHLFYIDSSDNSVWMPTFEALGTVEYHGTDISGSRNDTIITVYMMNEDYLTQNANPAYIHGTLYDDGSILFDDGFFYYYDIRINHYVNDTLQSTDYRANTSLIFRNLSLVVPNAKHDYHEDYYDVSTSADTYMYQVDDTTLVVMNLWGLGNQGNVMYIHSGIDENTFNSANYNRKISFDSLEIEMVKSVDFPFQRIIEIDASPYCSEYYWFYNDFYNFVYELGGASTTSKAINFCYIKDGVIKWDTNIIADYYTYSGDSFMLHAPGTRSGYSYPGLKVGKYSDNKLYFFDTPEPPEPEKAADPFIEVTKGDDAYTFTGIPTEDGTVVYLYTFDPTTGEILDAVENPYIVPRTNEDQFVCLEAIADGQFIGKDYSDWVAWYGTVPALPDPDPDPDPDYTLTLADAEVLHGKAVAIPVSMTNKEQVTAFQTDLYLPEGFVLQAIELSDRKNDQQINWNTMGDGVIRILCYSPSLQSFNGYEGTLFNITVKAPDDAEGTNNLYLKNTMLTIENFAEVRCADATSCLDVWPYIPGDSNKDGIVSVSDIVAVARYILDYDPQPFDFDAADMNIDGQITVTDVVLITCIIMDPSNVDLQHAPARGQNNNDAMSAEAIHLSAGESRTVAIALNNEFDYTAFQLDMLLPDGLTANDFRLTDRAGSHTFITNEVDGKQRVMCYSPALATIASHEGALLIFNVTATSDINADIMVDGIEMVTASYGTVHLNGFAISVNSDAATSVKEIAGNLRIYAEGQNIVIESPKAENAIISDIAGHTWSVNLQAGRNEIPVNASGIYIVGIREKTAKLMIK